MRGKRAREHFSGWRAAAMLSGAATAKGLQQLSTVAVARNRLDSKPRPFWGGLKAPISEVGMGMQQMAWHLGAEISSRPSVTKVGI